jgi:GT2 family glycosyltransferase
MSIFAILVIYHCKIRETKALASLLQNYSKNPEFFRKFKLIVYDNSLRAQDVELAVPFEYEYVHDSNNSGLGVAYNYALNEATKESYDWLLLLDQDSYLPENFFSQLEKDLIAVEGDPSIAAVVPRVLDHQKPCSPARVFYGGTLRPIEKPNRGICTFSVFAIGSGSVIRISFLRRMGGFNTVFWLDCLDRWLFFKIHEMGGKVFITDSIIEHELSVMNYDKRMSERRYSNILKYETLFMKTYKSQGEYCVFCLRLLKRSVYLYFTLKNKSFAAMTFSHLKRIILGSKDTLKSQRGNGK